MTEHKAMSITKLGSGYYNASDLNRVEEWCRYLADELNLAGYNITITTKTDWTTLDLRTASGMDRIRSNILAIMQGFHYITSINSSTNQWDYEKANNWEKILFEIYNLMWGMEDWYVYSGVASSGQNRVWQHRFRQFFVPASLGKIWTQLTQIYWNDFQINDTWEEVS